MLGDAIELRSLLEPLVERMGYELVHVTMVNSRTRVLRMFIDAPGGITVDDCARVSRRVGDVLDVEDTVDGEYTLEVSSPGLNRPLVKKEHFEQVRGKNVSIQLQSLHVGRKKFLGSLIEADKDAVVVEVDGELYELFYRDMQKANLVSKIGVTEGSRTRRGRGKWETTKF
jgi:ribosome maturation factor RimP